MAVTLHPPVVPADAPRRFTLAEYDLIPDDAFGGARVELIEGLIEGLIYAKTGHNFPHIAAGRRVTEALRAVFGGGFNVSSQWPIGLGDDSKPEPDVLVLRGSVGDYDARYPDPRNEIALLVEVSDFSLARDTDLKARLYAAHGVPEYWVVNLQGRTLEIRRRPLAGGMYAETILVPEGGTVDVGSGRVAVADLLPRPEAPASP